jgi:hypothetical protein
VGYRLADILEIFAGLEADRPPRWDADFLAGPWVAADPSFARLHLEDPEATKLDSLATLHGQAHRVEYRVDCHLGFHLGDVGDFETSFTMSTLIMLRLP